VERQDTYIQHLGNRSAYTTRGSIKSVDELVKVFVEVASEWDDVTLCSQFEWPDKSLRQ